MRLNIKSLFSDIQPVSVYGEIRMLELLEHICKKNLAKFETSIIEDKNMLVMNKDSDSLSENEMNIVRVRLAEKEILYYLIDFANDAIMALNANS